MGTLATSHADAGIGWDALPADWDTRRVNHSIQFYDNAFVPIRPKANFRVTRRRETGMDHPIDGPCLHAYAGEAAWRETTAASNNGSQAMTFTSPAMNCVVSRRWKCCWQRALRKSERQRPFGRLCNPHRPITFVKQERLKRAVGAPPDPATHHGAPNLHSRC
jgi:hypothetical protein